MGFRDETVVVTRLDQMCVFSVPLRCGHQYMFVSPTVVTFATENGLTVPVLDLFDMLEGRSVKQIADQVSLQADGTLRVRIETMEMTLPVDILFQCFLRSCVS